MSSAFARDDEISADATSPILCRVFDVVVHTEDNVLKSEVHPNAMCKEAEI